MRGGCVTVGIFEVLVLLLGNTGWGCCWNIRGCSSFVIGSNALGGKGELLSLEFQSISTLFGII